MSRTYVNGDLPAYSIAGLDRVLNLIIGFIYYYRLIFVLGLVALAAYFGNLTWQHSKQEDQIKNLVAVFTGSSIIIGIFYTILNHEYNHSKRKTDAQLLKKTLAYNTSIEWHKPAIVANLKTMKLLYNQNKHLIEENKSKEFSDLLDQDEDARSAMQSIFNYFECIAVGIENNILDQDFIKDFFCSVFKQFYNEYSFYIDYRRKKNNTPSAWVTYTRLAQLWLDRQD